jgi:hypothetical protein
VTARRRAALRDELRGCLADERWPSASRRFWRDLLAQLSAGQDPTREQLLAHSRARRGLDPWWSISHRGTVEASAAQSAPMTLAKCTEVSDDDQEVAS